MDAVGARSGSKLLQRNWLCNNTTVSRILEDRVVKNKQNAKKPTKNSDWLLMSQRLLMRFSCFSRVLIAMCYNENNPSLNRMINGTKYLEMVCLTGVIFALYYKHVILRR